MKNTLAIFSLKSISKFVIQFLGLIFLISLSACYRKEILNFPGIILTLPNDDPITDTIIWSSAEPNIILASGADYPSHITNIHTIDISTLEKQVVLDEEPGDLNIASWSPDEKYVLLTVAYSRSFPQKGVALRSREQLKKILV